MGIGSKSGRRWGRFAAPIGLAALVVAAGAGRGGEPPAGEVTVALRTEGQRAVVVVSGLTGEQLARLEEGTSAGRSILQVFVGSEPKEGQPAILGSYRVIQETLVFEPRFPLEAGVAYRAVVVPPSAADSSIRPPGQVTVLKLPEEEHPPTRVAAVYPSADVLPENQLKFYVHFSAPMRQGDSYRYVHMLEESGREIDLPFVNVGSELWDRSGRRITLLLDPGRIKRGLRPREELGPILREGHAYRLVIDAAWRDANGNPLTEPFIKEFRAAEPDDRQPDPRTWRIAAPGAGSRQPLVVAWDEPLDHALLQHALTVVDAQGRSVPGHHRVAAGETQWSFVPDAPWQAGRYRLEVDTALEDLAGNSIERPFEVDVFERIEQGEERTTVSVVFEVERGAAGADADQPAGAQAPRR